MANFEAFLRVISSSINILFLKSALSPMPIWCSWLLFPKTSGYTIIEGWQQQWRRWCPHILPEGNSFKSPAHHHLIYTSITIYKHIIGSFYKRNEHHQQLPILKLVQKTYKYICHYISKILLFLFILIQLNYWWQ